VTWFLFGLGLSVGVIVVANVCYYIEEQRWRD
jgi:hypothetical protein